jgi:hypothetical protein
MGLVEHLLDSQRTINDCTNKQLEWKNHALIPQLLAPVGSIRTKRTDKPGAIIEYIPINGAVPEWQPVPPVPPELSSMKDGGEAGHLRHRGADESSRIRSRRVTRSPP